MSMVACQLLNEIVLVREIHEASLILVALDEGIRKALKQKETRTNDGMDLALCVIDQNKKELTYAGAKNPLIYIQNNQLNEIKGYRVGIGGEQRGAERNFEQHSISFAENPTSFYLFSDGFQDQFGGEETKKYSRFRLKNFLQTIQQLPMDTQQTKIEHEFQSWKGETKQIDDVLFVGFHLA
jgi:serine phosphatase RsbU (regulator of sigma subunit)